MASVGRTLTYTLTIPILGAATAASKAAIEYETAFVGVIKTNEGLGESFSELTRLGTEVSDGLRRMAREIPNTAAELSNIAAIAGQYGVQNENLLDFTKIMAQLGDTTSLTAGQAASELARFMNIFQSAPETVSNLGSSIVALGNNFATTETEIVDMALRIAGAGQVAELAEADVLGLSTAVSALGIHAELGGTAISRVLSEMVLAVSKGEEGVALFADVLGVTSKEFLKLWENDPTEVFLRFVEGLARIDDEGGNVIATLNGLELGQLRVRDTLLRMAGAGDLTRRAVETANQAWLENTALQIEAERRYTTLASQLQVTKNILTDLGITIGMIIIPFIREFLTEYIVPAIEWFSSLDTETQKWILGIGLLAAAIGPALLILSGLVTILGAIASPIGLIVVGIAALVAAFVASQGGIQPAIETLMGIWDAFANWIQPVIDNFVNIWNAIWPQLNQLIQAVLGEVVPFAKAMIIDMATTFGMYFQIIKDWVDQNWPLIAETITTVLQVIEGIFNTVWPLIRSVVVVTWDAIKAAIEIGLNSILGIIKVVMLLITGDWQEAWQLLQDTLITHVTGMWTTVSDFFGRIWQTIVDWITKVWYDLFGSSLIPEIVEAFAKAVEDIWLSVEEWFSAIWTSITEWITKVVQDIMGPTGLIPIFISDILVALSTFFTGVDTQFKAIWTSITTWVQQVADDVIGPGTILGNMIVAIETAFSKVYGYMTQPFEAVKSYISRLHIPLPHFSVSWQEVMGVRLPKGVSVKWYGGGLDTIFSSPTLIGVGERGPERVQVTPLGRNGAQGGGQDGQTINYNVTVNAPTGDANTTVARMMDALKMMQMGTVAP